MTRLVVLGSGASGVHFALTALERGHQVTLVDAGIEPPEVVAPDASITGLKEQLADPAAWFLGDDGRAVVYPASKPSYYGHPPSKEYVFRQPREFRVRAERMAPLFSFARGGLAEAWTGGAYAFHPADLADFPFDYEELRPHYATVVGRIGVGAEPDDLSRFIPLDAPYLPPLPLDPHSRHLLGRYQARRSVFNEGMGFYLGRSRVATLSTGLGERRACGNLGRCLWGCPRGAIYTPAHTLGACAGHPGFRYLRGLLATHFEYREDGRVEALVALPLAGGPAERIEGELFVLAAGALSSSRLVLDSVWRGSGRVETLGGLMDNRQVHVPFLTPARLGSAVEVAGYQYHLLAFGLTRPDPAEYIHAQITTLKAASVHPIVQGLPIDLRGALQIFRSLRAGLALANVNFWDRRRPASQLTVQPLGPGGDTELVLRYADDPGEPALVRESLARVRRALRRLGCLVPPGMTRMLPKGGSVHYTGTLPFAATGDPPGLTCAPDGRLRRFTNLHVADGATFPFLPAKNLTLTLMANASRIASLVK